MARDDDVDAFRGRIDLHSIQVVQDVDRDARESCHLGVCEFGSSIALVHVASDRRDRRDPAERWDDVGIADVATVDDVIDAGEETLRLRAE